MPLQCERVGDGLWRCSCQCGVSFDSTERDALHYCPLSIPAGPGTELHSLLGRFGLTTSGDCKCNSRAAYMDQQGCDWCEANLDEIVGWLRESAAERGLPFLDAAGRLLVRRAISNARRKEAAKNQP